MRLEFILLIAFTLLGCSADQLSLVPTKGHLAQNHRDIVLIGRISDSQIEPNYTFRENFLQPTPSIPKKGWKGSITLDILAIVQGVYGNRTIAFNNVHISNDYGMSTITGAGIFFPGDGLYMAFDQAENGRIERALITPLDFLSHTVVAGDTLSGITRQYYGDAFSWRFVYEANRHLLRKPNDLQIGMELTIPPFDEDDQSP